MDAEMQDKMQGRRLRPKNEYKTKDTGPFKGPHRPTCQLIDFDEIYSGICRPSYDPLKFNGRIRVTSQIFFLWSFLARRCERNMQYVECGTPCERKCHDVVNSHPSSSFVHVPTAGFLL
uniref:Uncharacterized protein n=1 Tax=Romanomermis culicivorax TaxID=13658 RepID=A0A915JY23_ROMCU